MRQTLLLFVAGLAFLVGAKTSFAQNCWADYVRNVPRQYDPHDPWTVGVVMRNQIGWGGMFFNCDCEEDKRLSPYIHWEQQPTVCCPHCHCWDIKQQIFEVKQRVRTGSCRQCEYILRTHCTTSEPPVQTNCPNQLGDGSCPSCGDKIAPEMESTERAAAPTADETNWFQRLYPARRASESEWSGR